MVQFCSGECTIWKISRFKKLKTLEMIQQEKCSQYKDQPFTRPSEAHRSNLMAHLTWHLDTKQTKLNTSTLSTCMWTPPHTSTPCTMPRVRPEPSYHWMWKRSNDLQQHLCVSHRDLTLLPSSPLSFFQHERNWIEARSIRQYVLAHRFSKRDLLWGFEADESCEWICVAV